MAAAERTPREGPLEDTGPPGELAEGPGLPVAAVARRLGVAPATLRTWDRRYGLGPSEHASGAHRRYGPEDVLRLETMRRLTLAGVAPGEAARQALQTRGLPTSVRMLPGTDGRLRRGGPGGRVLALPGAEDAVVGLGRAAMALDSDAVLASVRASLSGAGVLSTWEHLLRPVLAAAGARWASTGEGVEVEHLLSDCVTAALREVAASRPPASVRPVLLASAPEDQHALPLHALAAALAERGTGCRVLGGSLPASALQAAVRRIGPSALFVWSQLAGPGGAAAVADLPVQRPPTAVVVGGPGWRPDELPERVTVARDLADAVELLASAAAA